MQSYKMRVTERWKPTDGKIVNLPLAELTVGACASIITALKIISDSVILIYFAAYAFSGTSVSEILWKCYLYRLKIVQSNHFLL